MRVPLGPDQLPTLERSEVRDCRPTASNCGSDRDGIGPCEGVPNGTPKERAARRQSASNGRVDRLEQLIGERDQDLCHAPPVYPLDILVNRPQDSGSVVTSTWSSLIYVLEESRAHRASSPDPCHAPPVYPLDILVNRPQDSGSVVRFHLEHPSDGALSARHFQLIAAFDADPVVVADGSARTLRFAG